MPTLNEVVGGNTSGIRTVFTTDNIAIEPLNGPHSVEDLMDRFPEETYQQGRDTHLFRLLQALTGDSGAGLAKKQAFASRLRYEAEFVEFDILNDVYVSQFHFQRLRSETYIWNVDADALTPTQWDQVQLADQSYAHRMAEWWEAVRYGTGTEGMRLAAQAGAGVDCDIAPQYRFIHDLYSDLPLGVKPEGITTSCEEFTVLPRFLPGDDVSYMTPWERIWTFTPPDLDGSARPVPAPGAIETILTHVTPSTRIEAVGSARAGRGASIAIEPHQKGDLIVVVGVQFGAQPALPAPGGTVPAWSTVHTALTYSLGYRIGAFVATGSGHTTGAWTGTGYMMSMVFRATNGTLAIGSVASNVSPANPGTPFLTYPGLTLLNRDGGSAVLRVGAIRETGDSQINNVPGSYTPLAQYGVRQPGLPPVDPTVSVGFAALWRQAVLDCEPATVRITNSGGPGSSIATSVEIRMIPDVPVETRTQRKLRYQLEEDTAILKQPFDRLLPELERNTLQMLDRLRPVTSEVTFKPEDGRFTEQPIAAVAASSERVNVARLVTGAAEVPWPAVDAERNFFIVASQETEPGYFFGSNRDLPVVFLTIETARAYTSAAEGDPDYGTNAFFEAVAGVSPYDRFRSVHSGAFFPVVSAIFPFVFNVLSSATFEPEQAIAVQNTPLVLEGSAVA